MIYLALIHRFRFWSIVAVETNPCELVDFCISGGTLYSLKVFGGCTEDLGKLFVWWGLCGTFIWQSPRGLAAEIGAWGPYDTTSWKSLL